MENFISNKKTCMDLEIHEQPVIMGKILEEYLSEDDIVRMDVPQGITKVVLVASGSSYHCARYGADLFGTIADISARAIYSSEFLLKPKAPVDEGSLYIFITQSGETSDTLRAAKRAQQLGMKILCITNNERSSISEIADYTINCYAGVEKAIAATKSFTAQMLCLYLITLKYAQMANIDVSEKIKNVRNLPFVVLQTFDMTKKINQLAGMLKKEKNFIITADGISYALAKEAALKIQETSYLNVTAMILGEFMHGHVAVLNNKIPLVYVSASGVSYSASKNLEKIKKDYNPPIYIIGRSHERITPNFNITIDNDDAVLRMFSNAVVIQMLALEIAKKLGRDVDKPKGLVKVVTEN
ncbi:MAG: SIS domain-containing protein [Candidatus Gastranaerophilaceae bacterium]